MMSKFHKTTYSRTANFNGVASSHARRNTNTQQPTDHLHLLKDNHLERKIQIQSSLLLNHKNYPPTSLITPEQISRKITNKSQAKLYQTSTGFGNIRQRPQSKQEPRTKGIAENKMKTQVFLPDRPQTSKGVRHFRGKVSEQREHQTQNYEQFPIQVKITEKKNRNARTGYSKKGNQSNIVAFDTSIDPEFLSLFAN